MLLALLQNLTARSTSGSSVKVALVENEVGDVSIDGDVLAAGGMNVRNLFFAAKQDIHAINPMARTLRTCRTEPLPQELYDLLASGRAAN